jgi:hypothetical protein
MLFTSPMVTHPAVAGVYRSGWPMTRLLSQDRSSNGAMAV